MQRFGLEPLSVNRKYRAIKPNNNREKRGDVANTVFLLVVRFNCSASDGKIHKITHIVLKKNQFVCRCCIVCKNVLLLGYDYLLELGRNKRLNEIQKCNLTMVSCPNLDCYNNNNYY